MSTHPQRPDDFALVLKSGRIIKGRNFRIHYYARTNETARLGIAVAKRNIARAVDRNRIKRICRESFRHHRAALCGNDVVVRPNPAASRTPNSILFGELSAAWARMSGAASNPV